MLTVWPVKDLAFFLIDVNEKVLPFSQTSVNSNIQQIKFGTWKNLISCRHCNLKQQVTRLRPLREGRTCQGTAQSAAKRAAVSSYMEFSSITGVTPSLGKRGLWIYPIHFYSIDTLGPKAL